MHKLLCGLVILSCAICFTKGDQCWMEGVENWLLAVTVNIMDTDREVEILRRSTENIEEIIDVTQGEALNRGPYLTMSLEDSSFVISTNAAFNTYENDETSLTIGSVVQFRCTSGSTSMLVITVSITDTNNHSPEFVPSNYEFTIAPPVPPGFLVTDCISDVLTKDVDLTTYRIDYEIQGSDLFEIAYDESSTEPKNFKAILRTATFIRTLPEPIVLRVTATDVDLTGNDPRSVDSTITIHANSEFEFPDEPIFSQAYYLASYTDTHLELPETISLRQGYDDQVTFSFDGDLKEYFQLVPSNNEVSFRVISAIPVEEYPEDGQIYLVVSAEREYTSGAMATVVVQFPRDSCSESSIRFSQDYYVGSYEEGIINLDPITLNPYPDDAYVEDEIIKIGQIANAQVNFESNFLVLTLEASTLTSRAHTIIVLKIINDGQTTLTILNFSEAFYVVLFTESEGLIYNSEIVLGEGYDESVRFSLEGENSEWFTVDESANPVVLKLTDSLPDEVIQNNSYLSFAIRATNEENVVTRATIIIEIVSDRQSEDGAAFDKVLYIGQFQENVVTHEAITVLNHDGSPVLLSGGFAQLFEATINTNGVVTVSRVTSGTIPADVTSIPLEITAGAASAVLIINILSDGTVENTAAFDKVLYIGQLQENVVTHETITVLHHDGSPVLLSGSYAQLFEATINTNGVVTVSRVASGAIPADATSIPVEMTAGAASAVLIINVLSDGTVENTAAFDKVLYIGQLQENVVTHETITVLHHDGSPVLLSGSYAQLFEATINTNGVVTVSRLSSGAIPADVTSIPVEMTAGAASAVLIINILSDGTVENTAAFDKVLYIGQLQENVVTHETITVLHHDGSPVLLSGSYAQLFEANINTNGVVTVSRVASGAIPADVTSIPLEMTASLASAVLVINIQSDGPVENTSAFDKILYIGQLQDNVITHETITVLHHDGSPVILSGGFSQYFDATILNGVVTVSVISSVTILDGISNIPLEMTAGSATAVLVLNILTSEGPIENRATFDKVLYMGQVEGNTVTHEAISIINYDGSPVLFSGDYAQFFEATILNEVVTVTAVSSVTVPDSITNIPLEMTAGSATAVLMLSIITSEGPIENRSAFDKVLYMGQIEENTVTHEEIIIINYDGSPVQLFGDYSQLFEAVVSNNIVTVTRVSSAIIPADITNMLLEMTAGPANAVLSLSITSSGNPSENRASFDKVLYIGLFQENVVSHETITVLHHDGAPVILSGEYEQLFEASITNGVVTVSSASSVTIPEDIASIPLELRAGEASAVLILNVLHSDQPVLPTVTFSSSSYTLRTDVSQAGVIGTVHATADNGEPITYTLLLENDHLRGRLSVNSDGEISLSAPAASGGYNFQVQATAIVNRVSAVAEVSLWVEAVTVCDTDIVLHPLIVIERLEEEPHRDLVILNQQQYAGCEFELTNHWPRDQNWLYVDAEGLHARVIDREHESIAFMHVSQVQVEIVLHCENDSTRRKRSLDAHEYGSKSWILTDTILYNSRRSLVNLIVIDINDNAPIFVGKESEPIYVGYPTNELEDTILPRSLVELKATDADIGENAELLYWSAEENLAVAPTTGFVHVRQSALLEDNSQFTIYATDQNGRGLNGSIDIVVKLLDENHIAVVTINDAFLDDEESIITDISTALCYDVKILKAAVVSTDTGDITRMKRETDNTGASLQLYVYGIEENNAVHVDQLTSDISNSDLTSVSIARVLSLEDHLLQICPLSRDTALLAATISLAVLLLLIVTMVTVREVLKRKQGQPNYEQFSDVNSLESRNNSVPVLPKVESLERPKLNIDELRKSEKRLQDMLNEDRREPVEKKETEPANESIIDMPVPLTPEPVQHNMPIVIQSIDKLKDDDSDGDEYGEVQNNRRKSVVTFNENVEKIIHIEDRSASISSDSTDFEVYKF